MSCDMEICLELRNQDLDFSRRDCHASLALIPHLSLRG